MSAQNLGWRSGQSTSSAPTGKSMHPSARPRLSGPKLQSSLEKFPELSPTVLAMPAGHQSSTGRSRSPVPRSQQPSNRNTGFRNKGSEAFWGFAFKYCPKVVPGLHRSGDTAAPFPFPTCRYPADSMCSPVSTALYQLSCLISPVQGSSVQNIQAAPCSPVPFPEAQTWLSSTCCCSTLHLMQVS